MSPGSAGQPEGWVTRLEQAGSPGAVRRWWLQCVLIEISPERSEHTQDRGDVSGCDNSLTSPHAQTVSVAFSTAR